MRITRAVIVAILLGIATMTPARADTVYAYWSYWQGDAGAWKYAQVGPATSTAIDGAVDGWRFTLGSDGKATQPASDPDFAAICGGTAKPADAVRVAVFIDFGTASTLAPTTHCAVVATGLSRMSALGTVADLRLKNGFICAIDAVPENGCGDAVVAPSTPLASASSAATPVKTAQSQSQSQSPASATPIATASATTESNTLAIAESTPQASVEPKRKRDPGSPLSTIVTMILAGIALALALRNAKRQQAAR